MRNLEHSFSVRISPGMVPVLERVSTVFSRVRVNRIKEREQSGTNETVVFRFHGPRDDVSLLRGLLFQPQQR